MSPIVWHWEPRRSLQVPTDALSCTASAWNTWGWRDVPPPFQIIRLVKVIYMKFYTRWIVNMALQNHWKWLENRKRKWRTTFVLGKRAFRTAPQNGASEYYPNPKSLHSVQWSGGVKKYFALFGRKPDIGYCCHSHFHPIKKLITWKKLHSLHK